MQLVADGFAVSDIAKPDANAGAHEPHASSSELSTCWNLERIPEDYRRDGLCG
jgi:hypothetical protein